MQARGRDQANNEGREIRTAEATRAKAEERPGRQQRTARQEDQRGGAVAVERRQHIPQEARRRGERHGGEREDDRRAIGGHADTERVGPEQVDGERADGGDRGRQQHHAQKGAVEPRKALNAAFLLRDGKKAEGRSRNVEGAELQHDLRRLIDDARDSDAGRAENERDDLPPQQPGEENERLGAAKQRDDGRVPNSAGWRNGGRRRVRLGDEIGRAPIRGGSRDGMARIGDEQPQVRKIAVSD